MIEFIIPDNFQVGGGPAGYTPQPGSIVAGRDGQTVRPVRWHTIPAKRYREGRI